MRKNIASIIGKLKKTHKLSFFSRGKEDPFYVLISTVLSQRATDTITYRISPLLFRRYKTPKQFVSAKTGGIEKIIRPIGFYRTKARRIKEISEILVDKHNGKVPDEFEALMALPGVGRKTANCVLVYAFRKPAIPVDTHVHRISNRLGLVKTKTPEDTEQRLMEIVLKKHWIIVNELFVKHGQEICRPITPLCEKCPLTKECDYYNKHVRKR